MCQDSSICLRHLSAGNVVIVVLYPYNFFCQNYCCEYFLSMKSKSHCNSIFVKKRLMMLQFLEDFIEILIKFEFVYHQQTIIFIYLGLSYKFAKI